MKAKHFILSIVVIFSFITVAYSKDNEREKMKEEILSLALLSTKSHDPNYKLEDMLEKIDKLQVDDAMVICVELLDYYIGEHTGGMLVEKITTFGEKILPYLVQKRNTPIQCLDKYKNLCNSFEERHRYIEMMINAIKDGTVSYAEFPEGLKEREAEKDIKIIKIFIEDYKKTKGKLPKDLTLLREYVWKKYGYKLKILNSYAGIEGKPLKYLYSLQKDDKYILEIEKDIP